MAFKNTADHYGLASKLLHWIIAALMLTLLALGAWMVDLSYYDPWYHDALSLHKSLGFSLGIVVMLKLAWRVVSPMPGSQSSLTAFEMFVSRQVHRLLWCTMLVLPATGYLISSSEGAAIELFNAFSLPALWQVSDSVRDVSISLHYYLAYLMLGFVLLHAAAALKHQFIDRKGTLKRML